MTTPMMKINLTLLTVLLLAPLAGTDECAKEPIHETPHVPHVRLPQRCQRSIHVGDAEAPRGIADRITAINFS